MKRTLFFLQEVFPESKSRDLGGWPKKNIIGAGPKSLYLAEKTLYLAETKNLAVAETLHV